MRSSARPVRRGSPAASFRTQIEKAEDGGCARGDMTLCLTLGDASLLKRDPTLAVTDIAFADGAMTFLGVPIQEGGVTESKLVVAKASDAS